jgi:hypothetical protein
MLVIEHPAKVRLARQNASDCGQRNAMRTQGKIILGVTAVAASLVTAAPAHARDYFIDGRAASQHRISEVPQANAPANTHEGTDRCWYVLDVSLCDRDTPEDDPTGRATK